MYYKKLYNQTYLYLILAVILIWIIFKQFYPYPFITVDSCLYIDSASKNLDIDYWPIGYSKFIYFISLISHSPTWFVTIQFLILQFSFFYLFVALKSIFRLSQWAYFLIIIFTFFNPLFIIASNHVMSDVLFTAITILWITQLLYIIVSPRPYMIYSQAILVLVSLTLRYTALYYPAITILAFSVSPFKFRQKVLGVILTFLLLGIFIEFTRIKMESISGVKSFSSSNGWKKANNALYMYANLADTDTSSVPDQYKLIHKIITSYFKGPHKKVDLFNYQSEPSYGCFYMFSTESPLIKYDSVKTNVPGDLHNLTTSPRCNILFNSYGNYLIKKYPLEYVKNVIYPNIIAYYSPILEIYGNYTPLYSEWAGYYGEKVKTWFNLKRISNPDKYLHFRGMILSPSMIVFSMIHTFFLLSLVIMAILINFKKLNTSIKYSLLLLIAICVINFLFYIALSPSVLRYQFNIIIIEFFIPIWLIDCIRNSPDAVK